MGSTFTYAEEKNLTDLRATTLRKLRVSNTSRYSTDSSTADYAWIDEALNKALQIFVRETKCLRSWAAYVPIANYQYYRLPADFLDLKTAYYYDDSLSDGYKLLIPKTLGEMNDEYSDWRTDTGSPSYIFIDRMFGRRWFMGIVPIPSDAGTTVTFDSTYGCKLSEICNLYLYNEERIELPQTDEYFVGNSELTPGMPFDNVNKDIVLEYYRMARELDTTLQVPEIPREYHDCLTDYACFDLLQHNPEDAAEYKRAMDFRQRFKAEIDSFRGQRDDKQLRGKELKARAGVQTWYRGMSWYNGIV